MALAGKVKYWALNYYYMSVGKELPEDRLVRVNDAIVNSDYKSMYEEPLIKIAKEMEVQYTDSFAEEVMKALHAAKLPCMMHLLSFITPYFKKEGTLEEAVMSAVNEFKVHYKRCLAICKGGSTFSTYSNAEGYLIGDYPADCIFIGFSESVKTRGDLIGELLQQNPSKCDIAYLYAIMNLNNGGMFEGKFIPSYNICGKSVTLIEYAENYEVLRMLENMPSIYEDKWAASIEHLTSTGRNPDGLRYLKVKCGMNVEESSSEYSGLIQNLQEQAKELGMSEEDLANPDNFYITDTASIVKEWMSEFGQNITLSQLLEYFSSADAVKPREKTADEVVNEYFENGGIIPERFIPKPEPVDKRAIAVDYVENCKTISQDLKESIIQSLTGNATEILDIPQVNEKEIIGRHIANVREQYREKVAAALAGEPVEFEEPKKEEVTDDYFLLAGTEILQAARAVIWADPSPKTRMQWGSCVQAFLRLLTGVEANKDSIKEHLSRLASSAPEPAVTELFNSVIDKYFN